MSSTLKIFYKSLQNIWYSTLKCIGKIHAKYIGSLKHWTKKENSFKTEVLRNVEISTVFISNGLYWKLK